VALPVLERMKAEQEAGLCGRRWEIKYESTKKTGVQEGAGEAEFEGGTARST
jgi:hypothetical protein